MNSITQCRWAPAVAFAMAWLLTGCQTGPREPTIRLEQVARELPGADPRWQQAEPAEVGLHVWRDAVELRASRGMLLKAGDVVQTGAQSAAVIRFSNAGTTVLDENTRVRVGSLEVYFGRIFANVRGLFETSSENIVAGVAGTRFLFQVQPDRAVRVSVADGVVICRSRQGGWAPVRMRANETLYSPYPNRSVPLSMPADARELRAATDWADQVSDAPAQGWCCVDGRVLPSWSNRCGGNFSANRAVAETFCRPTMTPGPKPGPQGWCCLNGEVYGSSRDQCKGMFSDNQASARRACIVQRVPTPGVR